MSGNNVGAFPSFRPWLRVRPIVAAAGAWTNGNYVGANGSVNVVSTNGAIFNVTGVKLEIGSVATPFPRQSLAKSMADCQRYYFSGPAMWIQLYSAAGAFFAIPIAYQTMRAAPTIALPGIAYTNASGGSASNISLSTAVIAATATALGTAAVTTTGITASAEL